MVTFYIYLHFYLVDSKISSTFARRKVWNRFKFPIFFSMILSL